MWLGVEIRQVLHEGAGLPLHQERVGSKGGPVHIAHAAGSRWGGAGRELKATEPREEGEPSCLCSACGRGWGVC